MNDTEKILSFGEMVEATEKLSRPWKKAFLIANVVHVIVEIALCILLGMMIYMAYMEPVEVGGSQDQDYDAQTQNQTYHYSENATSGN